MSNLIKELTDRGFIEQVSSNELEFFVAEKKITMYVGFDPTAESLHLGHLLPIMFMRHFQQQGHRVLALVGGATGMVGDPSGKSTERNLLDSDAVKKNVNLIKDQLEKFLDFSGKNPALMLNNNDWIGNMSFPQWLRDVGKYITVNYMLAKESVKLRLSSEQGISFTEFSYMTMQAFDFAYLADKFDCTLQCGGTDQWGNITAGIDLSRKINKKQVYGMTCPLLKTSSGEKFGKSAGNAVWLNSKLTSPYEFYQFWLQSSDEDVRKLLKLFTFLDINFINELCDKHDLRPDERLAQKTLANEVTLLVHGKDQLNKVQKSSEALFGGCLSRLTSDELALVSTEIPSSNISRNILNDGIEIIDLLDKTELVSSKSDARRLISNGGIYLNDKRIEDRNLNCSAEDLLHDSVLLLRAGKKRYHLLKTL